MSCNGLRDHDFQKFDANFVLCPKCGQFRPVPRVEPQWPIYLWDWTYRTTVYPNTPYITWDTNTSSPSPSFVDITIT